jgi:hypothetical protein
VDGAAGGKSNDEGLGPSAHSCYLLHDGDGKFCPMFGEMIQAGKVRPLKLPARSDSGKKNAKRMASLSAPNGPRSEAEACKLLKMVGAIGFEPMTSTV